MMASDLCVSRHFDAQRINEIINHPAVRPTCGGDGASDLDFTVFVQNPKNHALVWDHGCFLFLWTAPDTYEVHLAVLPEGRGRDAYRMAAEGIDYITAHGAQHLWARVARGHNCLRHYTAQAGFVKCGTDTLDFGFGAVEYDLYQWKTTCRR